MQPGKFELVDGPGAWTAADHKHSQDWVYQLTPQDLSELEAGVLSAQKSGKATKVDPSPGWCTRLMLAGWGLLLQLLKLLYHKIELTCAPFCAGLE